MPDYLPVQLTPTISYEISDLKDHPARFLGAGIIGPWLRIARTRLVSLPISTDSESVCFGVMGQLRLESERSCFVA